MAAGVSPRPRDLALPLTVFPPHAAITWGALDNAAAGQASRIHSIPFDQLHRVGGYSQTAQWGAKHTLSLHYVASFFDSADDAGTAYADAAASLWESGYPMRLRAYRPAFVIHERDGHVTVVLLFRQGPVQSELSLRYGRGTDAASIRNGLWYLRRAGSAASTVAGRVATLASPPAQGAAAVAPVFVAPAGTGPVVKSPSYMVLDSTLIPPEATAEPGSFHTSTTSVLAARATDRAALIPPGSLSRYTRTVISGGGSWYSEAALFPSPESAARAVDTLTRANHAVRSLSQFTLPPDPAGAGRQALAAQRQAWRGTNEIVAVFRIENVVMVLAETGQQPVDLSVFTSRLVGTVPSRLHTQGTEVKNDAGEPVRFAGLNWYGADQQDFIVGGLDFKPYETILQAIRRLGYNSIRIPFSNQMVEQNPVITKHIAANPDLHGLHALDILDRVINYAGALGLSVILDDHRSDAGWSAQENGLWYTQAYPDTAFVHDWSTLAARYAGNNVVVGADLRNEPHGSASWGDGNAATDWRAAAERAGDAVLAADPNLLVIVEGVQHFGATQGYWWGGNLMGVATAPVTLHLQDGSPATDRLVYSAHDYGPDDCNGGCPWFNAATTPQSLTQIWEQYWGFITDDPSKSYAAPVLVGEFGTCNYNRNCIADDTAGSQGQWFSTLVQYIAAKRLGWAYWSVNGTESTAPNRVYGTLDWYGLFTTDWRSTYPDLDSALALIRSDSSEQNPVPARSHQHG